MAAQRSPKACAFTAWVAIRADSKLLKLKQKMAPSASLLMRKPFPIVADLEPLLEGYTKLMKLAGHADRVIPGHDPLVTQKFPTVGTAGFVWRLDKGPLITT